MKTLILNIEGQLLFQQEFKGKKIDTPYEIVDSFYSMKGGLLHRKNNSSNKKAN